jgi:NAD(P)H-dependent FMN reductase
MKTILAIVGSASENSANQRLVEFLAKQTEKDYKWIIFNELKSLPHFDPELSVTNPPEEVIKLRKQVEQADGMIICTPEYVFSIPSGLKNAIEWCVSTTVFSDKPCGLITASAQGEKAHEELQLIMRTLMAQFTEETAILISGIKGKISGPGEINDPSTKSKLVEFIKSFSDLLMKCK